MDQSTHASTARDPLFDMGAPAVSGPFVVNLCASVAPIDMKPGGMPGLERYRLYQVRRMEDNRPRYRLRLGFFANEAATEVVLAAVREFYPAAFCVPAGSDDLKHAPGFDPATLGTNRTADATRDASPTSRMPYIQMPPPAKPAAVAPAKPVAAAPVMPKPAAPSAAPQAKPVSKMELLPDTPPRTPEAQAAAAEPFRVKPVDPSLVQRATADLSLSTDVPDDIRKLTEGATTRTDGPVLIDSTQTLRILTETELADTDAPSWFAVQVAVSDQAINVDAMPKLDIFKAFRLYSIAQTRDGRIEHSLRLGFFKESVSAEAVAGYLKTFFSEPHVQRVSAAEQSRFATPPAPPVLNETAGKSAQVIQLHADRRPESKPAAAPVLKRGPAPRPASVQKAPPPPAPKPSKQAAASAVARKSGPVAGKAKPAKNRPLNELLQEEAREVMLSESGIRRMEAKGSLLSRLVGKLTR